MNNKKTAQLLKSVLSHEGDCEKDAKSKDKSLAHS